VVDPVIDEEPTKVSYTWNFGDGTIRNSESKTISHSYVRSGIYKVNVRGEDNYGRFSSYEFDVEVINQKPVPSFVILGKEDGFKEGDEVSFDAKASQDPDDFIVSYVWDFGDGTNGTGVAPSHIFKTIGTHNVILTVYDQEGASDVFSDSIVIEEEDENIDVDYLSFAAALFGVIILFLIILTFGPKLAAQTKTIDVKEMGKTMKKELDDLFADAKVDLDQLIQEEARRQPMVAPVPIPVSGGEAAPVVAAPAAPAFNTSFCTSCGTSLEAGARFCTECGTSS
jgi:PKD repeat protein